MFIFSRNLANFFNFFIYIFFKLFLCFTIILNFFQVFSMFPNVFLFSPMIHNVFANDVLHLCELVTYCQIGSPPQWPTHTIWPAKALWLWWIGKMP